MKDIEKILEDVDGWKEDVGGMIGKVDGWLEDVDGLESEILGARLRSMKRGKGMSFEQFDAFMKKASMDVANSQFGLRDVIWRMRDLLECGNLSEEERRRVMDCRDRAKSALHSLGSMYKDAERVWLPERERREGYKEGKTKGMNEGRAQGFNEGKTKGMNEGRAQGFNEGLNKGVNVKVDKLVEEHEAREKAEAELKKPHHMMGRADWEREVIDWVRNKAKEHGMKPAVRLALEEEWVIEGAKHFKAFGSDGENGPTFGGLESRMKRKGKAPSAGSTQRTKGVKQRKRSLADDADAQSPNLPPDV